MSYSLQKVYCILNECESLQSQPASLTGNRETHRALQETAANISLFPGGFLQQSAALENVNALKLQIEIHLTAFTDLINRLDNLLLWTIRKQGSANEEIEGLQKIKHALLTGFHWLRQTFASHIGYHQQVPGCVSKEAKEMLAAEIPSIENNLRAAGMEEPGIKVTISSLQAITQTNTLTCYQLGFLGSLYRSIQDACLDTADNMAAIKWFIRQNLNTPSMIDYAMEKFRHALSDSPSLEVVLDKVEQFLKTTQQEQELNKGIYLGKPSVKEAVTAALLSEREYWKSKWSGLSAVYGSNFSQPVSARSAPLPVTLSVSQLAVFCRLFSDCGIIRHSNHTEMLKTVAGALQTTRATNISAESLRVKYYAPDPAALNIVKEHLHLMLNQLKKY